MADFRAFLVVNCTEGGGGGGGGDVGGGGSEVQTLPDDPTNADPVSNIDFFDNQEAEHSCLLNAGAGLNMLTTFVALPTFQYERSWLNADAPLNIP